MARWDKFLNEASRGYGLGFQRYEQYKAADDARKNRADMEAAMRFKEEAESGGTPTLGDAQSTFTIRNEALPVGVPFRQADGSIKYETVPTATGGGAPTAVPTSRELAPHEAPHRMAGGQKVDDPRVTADEHLTAIIGDPKVNLPEKRDNYVTKDGKPSAVAEPKSEVQATKQTMDELLGFVVPRGQRKSMEAVTEQVFQGDRTSTAEAWDAMENKLRQVYIRNGDMESLMGLDQKITAMQQERMTHHLTEAIRLVGLDPEAAGSALYKAYSYFPDGVEMDLRVKNGQLYGYGFDEKSGEFRGGMKLDEASLTRLLENHKDPVAFQAAKRAAAIAAEQTAYDRAKDKREHLLEKFKAESQATRDAAAAFKDTHLGLKYYGERMGYDSTVAATWGDFNSYDSYVNKSMEAVADRLNGTDVVAPEMQFIYENVPGSGFSISNITSSIAGNTPQSAKRAPQLNAQLAEQIFIEETRLNPNMESQDADMGRALEALGAQVPIEVANVRSDGLVEIYVGNEHTMVPADSVPSLVAAYNAGAQGPTEALPTTGAGTSTPPDPLALDLGGVSPAEKHIMAQARRSSVGTVVQAANEAWRVTGGRGMDAETLRELRDLPLEEVEAEGLNPEILAILKDQL